MEVGRVVAQEAQVGIVAEVELRASGRWHTSPRARVTAVALFEEGALGDEEDSGFVQDGPLDSGRGLTSTFAQECLQAFGAFTRLKADHDMTTMMSTCTCMFFRATEWNNLPIHLRLA